MIPFMGKRRNIVIAVLAALLVLVALSSGPTFDTVCLLSTSIIATPLLRCRMY